MTFDNIWQFVKDNVIGTAALFVAIVGVIVAIAIHKQTLKKNKRKARLAFKKRWILAQELEYKDFASKERNNNKEKYPEQNLSIYNPQQIHNLIASSKSILLIGQRNTGKTYFMINFLRKLKNTKILVPDLNTFNECYDNNFPKFKKTFFKKLFDWSEYKKIVIIDDAYACHDKDIDFAKISGFVESAIADGCIVWINTVSGKEYEKTEEVFTPKVLDEEFEKITIGDLPREERIKINSNLGRSTQAEYLSGKIGDIIDDKNIKRIYDDIKDEATEKKILKRIKQLYLMGFYELPFRVKIDDILKFEFSQSEKYSFDSSLIELKKVGFLSESTDKACVGFEEVYLINVIYPDMKVKDFMEEFSNHFPNNLAAYTQAMGDSKYDEAIIIFGEMKAKRMKLNTRPFAVLIRLSEDTDKGLQWLDVMASNQVEPNEYTIRNLFQTTNDDPEKINKVYKELIYRYEKLIPQIEEGYERYIDGNKRYQYHKLMKYARNYDKCRLLFEEMEVAGIKANSSTYCILISKSNFSTANQLLEEIISKGITPNCGVYANIINVSENFEFGLSILEKLNETEDLKPDKYVYGAVMRLAPNYKEANLLFHKMLLEDINIDSGTYGTLINKATFEIGKQLLSEWKNSEKHKVHLDYTVYGTLMSNAPNYPAAREIFEEMVLDEVSFTSMAYGTLIKKAGRISDGRRLLSEMEEKNVPITMLIYATLIYVSSDYSEGKIFFDEMKDRRYEPDKSCYATLISKCKPEEYDIAKSLFEEMGRKFDDEMDIGEYITFMNVPSDPSEKIKIFNEMIQKGIKPNRETYIMLIVKCLDYTLQRPLFDEMKQMNFKPDAQLYMLLINKCNALSETMQLFDEMKRNGFNANVETYGYLIKINPYTMACRLYDEMIEKGIPINHIIYATLISKSIDFIERKHWFDKMVEHIGFSKDDQGAYAALFINNNKIINYNYLECLSVYKKMIHEDIIPNEETYSHLIRGSRTIEEKKEILQEMKNYNVPLRNYSYVALIQKSRNYSEGRNIFEEMLHQGILDTLPKKDAIFAFNALLSKCKENEYQVALAIVEYELPKYNLTPNNYTNKLLARLSPYSDSIY